MSRFNKNRYAGTVSTSKGQSWTKNNDSLSFTVNGEQRVFNGKPNFERKKIVGLGSSVLFGSGATNNNGWFNQLATALTAKGYNVVNRGIGGNVTQDAINRFYTDVVPEAPDYVIIGLSLNNEGIAGTSGSTETTIYDRFKQNLIRLIKMCHQHDIIPIIASVYPNNGYTAENYRFLKMMHKEFDAMGVYYFNLLGSGDDLSGKWISGFSADGTHPNDAGHTDMFKAIPTTLFDNLISWDDKLKTTFSGATSFGNEQTILRPIEANFADTLSGSYTVSFWLRSIGATTYNMSFCGFGSVTARIRNPNTAPATGTLVYSPTSGPDIDLGIDPIISKKWHHIAISYNNLAGVTRVYADGVYINQATETINFNDFCLGGRYDSASVNAPYMAYKDVAIYRTRLNDEQIADLYHGEIRKGSLEIFAPLCDEDFSQNNRLLNLAPTSSYLKVNTTALTALKDSVTVTDVIANQVQLVGGGILYVNASGSLIYRKPNGTETTVVA